MPKQCLSLFTSTPIIQEVVNVYNQIVPLEQMYIATGEHLHSHFKKILQKVKYVIEPTAKNTAACIGLSLAEIKKEVDDDVVIIATADHIFRDPQSYKKHLEIAVQLAEQGNIVQLGITPSRIETGFGYIELGEKLHDVDTIETYKVASFKEKPDFNVAKKYVDSGRFLWNSGIFISKISVLMGEFQRFLPNLHSGLQRIMQEKYDSKIIVEVFDSLESISIDYGIIEKTRKTVMIKGTFPWDDIGDWASLERVFPRDEHKNIVLGSHSGTAKNCIIYGERRNIITDTTEELIIVDTEDATLVCDKDRAQDVKKIVDLLINADLKAYTEDLVKKYSHHNISIDTENCSVESDGVVALIGVTNIDLVRTKDSLIIKEGFEEDDESG